MENFDQWLTLEAAAQQYGYTHKESLTRRLRQLRRRGFVADFGQPPTAYQTNKDTSQAVIVLMWPNPKVALLRRDAPSELLDAKQGKRPKIPADVSSPT
ncbi:MAG: hypothetical protein KJ069_26020 [Anaerolineae bacterium]|nr:hypothetical protein [Anaerolineae bacterium]